MTPEKKATEVILTSEERTREYLLRRQGFADDMHAIMQQALSNLRNSVYQPKELMTALQSLESLAVLIDWATGVRWKKD